MLLRIAAFSIIIPFVLFDVGAATLTVDDLADTNTATTLRYALNNYGANDTITFSVAGEISLTGNLPTIDKPVTIDGPGAATLTINGGGGQRIFNINDGSTGVGNQILVVIDDLTLYNGGATDGGAIICRENLSVTNCIIDSCSATNGYGGGIMMGSYGLDDNYGHLLLDGCDIYDCSATAGGGGVNCASYYNASSYWGNGQLTITGCEFDGNTVSAAGADGGGVHCTGTERVMWITDSYIHDCDAVDLGGGVCVGGVRSILDSCTISANTADKGAGFTSDSISNKPGDLTMTNCTIYGNTADNGNGGGVYHQNNSTAPKSSDFINCTIAANSCTGSGGGLSSGGQSNFNIRNTIIAGNSATTSNPDISDIGAIVNPVPVDYSLISNTSGFNSSGCTNCQLNQNPSLGSLRDNGGPTPTTKPGESGPANQQIPRGSGDYNNSPSLDQRGYWIDRPTDDPDYLDRTIGALWVDASWTPARGFKARIL